MHVFIKNMGTANPCCFSFPYQTSKFGFVPRLRLRLDPSVNTWYCPNLAYTDADYGLQCSSTLAQNGVGYSTIFLIVPEGFKYHPSRRH